MGVYIPGMEIPKEKTVAISIHPDGTANAWRMFSGICAEYHEDCTVIPVPPHGDLIDREKIGYFKDECNLSDFDFTYRSQIDSMPTIIPSEKGEE